MVLRERCGVDGDVGRNTLKWFGHIERMGGKRVYESEMEGESGRGRLRMRWMDGVKKVCE